MRYALAVAIGAVLGGLIGFSGLLCPDGSCAITGSWYGGAVFGGVLGFLFVGGCPACAASGRCEVSQSVHPADESSKQGG